MHPADPDVDDLAYLDDIFNAVDGFFLQL